MSKTEFLPCVEVVTDPNAGAVDASVVWLHGLGADGNDFVPVVPYVGWPGAKVRFVFPTAPARPVTLNMGMIMPAWYDIRETDLRRECDEDGIRESSAQVAALIGREIERGVPASRIVLAGFSQGGAIALQAGLRYPKQLAGIMALSTYLPLAPTLNAERADANKNTGIFMAHGSADPVFSVADTVDWYENLIARYKKHTKKFARLFIVPGMSHSRSSCRLTKSTPLHIQAC